MPAPIDPNIKAAIEEAYINSTLTPIELAEQFEISDRTVRNWAKEGGWDAKRTAKSLIAKNIVEFAPRAGIPVPKASNPQRVRNHNPEIMSSIEIINHSIVDLYGDLGGAVGKDKAAIASALQRLVEYRDKLQPPTLDSLCDLVVEQLDRWKLTEMDFALRFKQRQEERKRA
jgi:hypothetical protein